MQSEKLSEIDELYMRRCLQLASKGLGYTYPNPMVGCVIVHQNKIIGEGWHQKSGMPHAETRAISSVQNPSLLSKSTLYVNLEPCNHFGKTDPCTNLIIEKKIPKVVIGIQDPNSNTNGKGIKKLIKNGCKVVVNVLEEKCYRLNKRFFTFHIKKRPYIILKWARSLDSFISPVMSRKKNKEIFWITNKNSIQCSHKLRSEENAILIGVNTVINDDPSLTTRQWKGNNPKRYIIDPNLRIPKDAKILKDKYFVKIINSKINKLDNSKEWIKCDLKNFYNIIELLYKDNIQSVIIEGGASTIQSFINAKVWDEAQVFTGDKILKDGISEPLINEKIFKQLSLKNDLLSYYYP